MTVSEVKGYIPQEVQRLKSKSEGAENQVSTFLDPRWDNLGGSQLRKWMRSHTDVAYRWYDKGVVEYYLAA